MITKKEKLEKISASIENELTSISKSKEKIKKLKREKKELENKIEKEKSKELFNYLSDFGIKSVEDFQGFMNEYSDSVNNENN